MGRARLRRQPQLPEPTTPFVGRRQELQALGRLFAQKGTRLVTISGPGGMGKTRLALAFGWRQRGQYASGVHFIPLAPLSAQEQILQATAHIVGLHFQGDREPQEQLLRFLKPCQALLIFDNFEHLRDGAGLLTAILEAAPQVEILVTSRERLGLAAERLYGLSGMQVPVAGKPEEPWRGVEAVRLFLSCARQLQPEFRLDEEDFAVVVELCRLMGGMPLALELAAAWIRVLSLAEIVDELRENLRILQRQDPAVLPRQRSMQASFDYSWRLLSEAEQIVLMKLSVFRGGFSRESASAVAGATVFTLSRLVDKSMVRREAASGRYQMHELLRQLADERLQSSGLAASSFRDHAQYFQLALATVEEQTIDESGLAAYERFCELELDNCRVAARRSIEAGHAETSYRLALSLAGFVTNPESLFWLESLSAAEMKAVPPRLQAEATRMLAHIMLSTDYSRGRAHWIEVAAQALDLFVEIGDELGIAKALFTLGRAYFGFDYERACTYLDQAIFAYEQLGMDHVGSHLLLANLNMFEGKFADVRRNYMKVTSTARKNEDELLEITAKNRLAQILYYEGELDQAKRMVSESFAFRSSRGRSLDPFERFVGLGTLVDVALAESNLAEAQTLILQRLRIAKEREIFAIAAAFLFHQIALWMKLKGRPEQAAFWIGGFDAMRDEAQQPMEKVEHPRYQRLKTDLRTALGEVGYKDAYQKGYQTPRDEAVDIAMSIVEQA